MAGNTKQFSLKKTAAAFAMEALPILSVPIQDVQLFDYALVLKTVNKSYGLQVNAGKTDIIGNDHDRRSFQLRYHTPEFLIPFT